MKKTKNISMWNLAINIAFLTAISCAVYFLYTLCLMDKNYDRALIILAMIVLWPIFSKLISLKTKLIGYSVLVLTTVLLFSLQSKLQTDCYKRAIDSGKTELLWEYMYEKTVPITPEAADYIQINATAEQLQYIEGLRINVARRNYYYQKQNKQ